MPGAFLSDDILCQLWLVEPENMAFIRGESKVIHGKRRAIKNLKQDQVLPDRLASIFLALITSGVFIIMAAALYLIWRAYPLPLTALYLFSAEHCVLLIMLFTVLSLGYFLYVVLFVTLWPERALVVPRFYKLAKNGQIIIGKVHRLLPIIEGEGMKIYYEYTAPNGELRAVKYVVEQRPQLRVGDLVAVLHTDVKFRYGVNSISILL